MYQYLMYGLIVHSDIPLYNLTQTVGDPDAYISYGKVSYDNVPSGSKNFYYSPDYVCFQTNHGAFSISNGQRITIEPTPEATLIQLTAYVIGWGFAFLFTQRGFSALHCTALDINGDGVLISGISGCGKSTTALSLIQRGYKYLADDIAMLNPLNSMEITPAYPIQKVCHNIIDSLNPENLLFINEERDKYSYYNTAEFCCLPRRLKAVIVLRCADIPSVQVEEVTGLNKYLRTLECLFLSEIYAFSETPEGDKYRCLKLAEQIHLYIITRPYSGNTLDEITDKIINLVTT
ncbi:MAG TPA: hypothetical protein VJY54_06745 [Lachnospiraceae bacterium]|nr:hypothetical protein [Lachnospiraceae bacterium]